MIGQTSTELMAAEEQYLEAIAGTMGFQSPGQTVPVGVGICLAEPELCVAIGATLSVYILIEHLPQLIAAVDKAIHKPTTWPACVPPVGTIGYRYDQVPPSRPHYPHRGDHVNLYRMQQNPNNGQCFWQRIRTTEPPPPPGAVPMGPPRGGTNP